MAVRDRLLELEYFDEGSSQTLYEIDIDDKVKNYDSLFLEKINQLKSNLNECYSNVNNIRELQKKVLVNMFKENEIVKTNYIIDSLINTTNSKVQFIINEIKGLDYDTCSKKFTESEVIMRRLQQKIIMNKVKEFIKEFTSMQQDYEQKIQDRLIRQHNIVNPNEEFIINKNIDNRYQIFANEILSSKVSSNKKNHYEAQTIYNNMKKIEKSISDLYLLSKEIQIMLESQNEIIGDVKIKVDEANNDVEEVNEELESAVTKSKQIRQTYKYIAYVVSTICVFLFIYLAVLFS
ncbi:t-SNARE [Anaeromyces robustus]|uniref:t-SNARE n=1 Tax=Anaeromyces robustus TaxID=1754192 RepID=A0A1Y1X562_9FUNG|nr:t-SNARE [Anaeromyces robustus]|eukprot:ORX80923.1 t-SNARE [Anaeromyces robustus]